MDAATAVEHADAASEAIRALNHITRPDVPAPLAYDLLGRLSEVGYRLDQLSRQIGAGLLRSLALYDVYDANREPEISYAMANEALIEAARHVYAAGERFAEAQAAISGQGHNGRLDEKEN
ncbi:hypothetical protein EV644_103670 [Kribbella orskensis]|uniref:Excreted virulence factor EspC (Type VII ESX diderm) n=1 Tax=Kribbella orskensis TaxID=2512216 RepID=A0ABY2BQR7_9ACTN|nr:MULTISPECIES: hypothetical protein [Kribbella]TCN28170.1 hypothetical protein EV642_1558 [Kribbella sp. VKM Ac-2500]TCO27966.1 hypothetical protein EV644_103670 [Kribbella orskensis]